MISAAGYDSMPQDTTGYLCLNALVAEELLHPLVPRLPHPYAHDPLQLRVHLPIAIPEQSVHDITPDESSQCDTNQSRHPLRFGEHGDSTSKENTQERS